MEAINIGCMVIIAIAIIGGLWHRYRTNKGIGIRFCQFMAITIGIPAIVILACSDKLEKHAVSALIGAVMGFLISRSGKDEANE